MSSMHLNDMGWLEEDEEYDELATIKILEKIFGYVHPKKDQAHPKLVPGYTLTIHDFGSKHIGNRTED